MKKKFTPMAILFVCASFITYAQTSDAEAEAIVNLLGIQKKEAVTQLISVSGKDSVTFWKIYEEYQQSNKNTNLLRIKLYEKTVMSYSKLTPALADSLAGKYFENRVEQEKHLENYYKKIKTATNAIVAFQFYQAETYLLTQIRASIMQQIPPYGQLKVAAKNK